ncbi:MAG: DUF4215 domain-containing protein [Myxococcales bacterium]|nr:DUF4215 domain-containing protein [Myxococcales bacterium]
MSAPLRRLASHGLGLTLLLLAFAPLGCGDDEPVDCEDGNCATCGDGQVGSGEECDDGNTQSGDGCSATCQDETSSGACGDGAVNDGEQCDDGNTQSGDGCSATCQNESASLCGNGAVDDGEECDDGNTQSGDGCSATCTGEGMPVCGNQIVEGDEACDDGNTIPFDGCENDCTVSPEEIECEVLTPLASGTCEVTAGSGAETIILGDVLGPYTIFRGGAVVVDASGTITCSGCDCDAPTATRVECPEAVISPGLINTHEHITFAKNVPYNDTGERYEHRHDWRVGANGHTEINASGSSSADQVRWGELRFMMSGATSLVGSGSATGFLRNLDRNDQEGLGIEPVHFSTFPLGDSGGEQLDASCSYPGGDTNADIASDEAYLPHIAEGIDGNARNEFVCTDGLGGRAGDEDLLEPQSAYIHGVGLLPGDYAKMAAEGTSLIWSPRSNVTLYGDTAVVTVADRVGVNIALGTDWIPTGSMNLFRELTCAASLNQDHYASYFTDRDLWRMVTLNAARALHQEQKIGVLAVGTVADIAVYDAKTKADYRAIIDGEPAGVALVMRGGEAIYGDANVVSSLAGAGCDAIDVCGTQKQLCTQSEIGKSFASLKASGEVYPAFFCGAPSNEPSCEPSRPVSVDGSSIYGGPTAGDADGDGVADASDNCPDVFNPIRPLDGGAQSDADDDGEGDACDVCPLNPDTDQCTAITPGDSDADGVPNAMDNCPGDPNPNQEDADNDDIGDACDACPMDPNPGNGACPATIYDVKQGLATGAVAIDDVIVTGCSPTRGYFVQHKMGDAAYAGAEHSGVFVYDPAVNCTTTPAGARVDIATATVSVFFSQIQLTNATATVTSTGEAAPTPVALTAAQASGTMPNAYEAVLATVSDVQVTSNNPPPGPGDAAPTNEFVVEGTLRVNDLLFLTTPLPAVGASYTTITGVLDFRNGNQKINPRSAADLVLGNPTLAGFSIPSTFVRVGQSNAPSIPVPLAVQLTAPAQGDTFVGITGGAGALTVTGGGVTVPNGQTSATVLLSGVSPAMNITLTATLGADMDTVTVRVLAANEQPSTLTISPSAIQVAQSGMTQVDLGLDIPAPAGGVLVSLAVTPGGAATVPTTVLIPADQIGASFSYVDLGVAMSATLDATAPGGLSDSAAVTVVQAGGLVINEVDYDQPSTDTTEFVEIFNPTAGPVSLAGHTLVFINGSNNQEYDVIDLAPAGSLAPGQYLVVGSQTLLGQISNGALELELTSIQNGAPDAVGLFANGAAVDVLSYEGSITAGNVSGVGIVNFVEGTATAASDIGAGSLSRLPNGSDTDNASVDWALASMPTPGGANVP